MARALSPTGALGAFRATSGATRNAIRADWLFRTVACVQRAAPFGESSAQDIELALASTPAVTPLERLVLRGIIADFRHEWRACPTYHKAQESTRDGRRHATADKIGRACAYVNAHAADHSLTLSEVARVVDLSVWHFSRTFKRDIGCGFSSYVLSVRLKKAAALLENSGCSIKEIMLECGFTHAGDFSRSFKAQFGCIPSLWRRGYETR